MPALRRALALEQVDGVAVRVGEDLDLDVPRASRSAARRRACHRRTTASASRRAAASASASSPASRTTFMPMPPPPAAGLISTGKPTRSAAAVERLVRLIGRRLAGTTGTPAPIIERPGADLRSHLLERRCRRADEDQPGVFARARRTARAPTESRNRDESASALGRSRGRDDRFDIQVAVARRRRRRCAPRDRLRSHAGRVGIGVGIDRDGFDAELAAGANDAARDLAAIGDQQRVGSSLQLRSVQPGVPLFEKRLQAFLAFGETRAARQWPRR